MQRIKYSNKRNQIKCEKVDLRHSILKMIHDTHKVICNIDLKKFRRYSAFSAILALEVF
jgi:hypothetical protein